MPKGRRGKDGTTTQRWIIRKPNGEVYFDDEDETGGGHFKGTTVPLSHGFAKPNGSIRMAPHQATNRTKAQALAEIEQINATWPGGPYLLEAALAHVLIMEVE